MISKFRDEYRFLSNFYFSDIVIGGKVWPTSENFYQASKTEDLTTQEEIRNVSPATAKSMGRKLVLRKDWENVKISVMEKVVREKFKQNKYLADLLVKTGNETIIEGNTWHDNIWGSCSCEKCKSTEGKNLLGKILMKIREELKSEHSS